MFRKEEGNNFYRNKDYKQSIVAYSKAIAADNTNAAYYTNRAAAYLMTLQFKEVYSCFFSCSYSCCYHWYFSQAINDCDKAISISPNNAKAFFRKATALKSLGKIDTALEALNAGLEFDPGNSVALGDVRFLTESKAKIADIRNLMTQKKFRQALPMIDQLLGSLGNSYWELNLMKVEALLEQQRVQDAYNLTNTLMRGVVHVDTELLRLRARCLYDMGDVENAVKHLQQALRSDPDNNAIRTWYRKLKEVDENKTQGNNAFKANQFEEAITFWTNAINLDRDHKTVNAKLHCNCANAYSKLRKHEEAIRECDKAIRYDRNFVKAYMRRAESNYAIGSEQSLQKALE